ncbi:MAG TPA: hypothetical protein DCR97_09965 [Deltaproteobacteria bacterium]|nr:hypothetical protein [Deltaproteobacteria bacterium]
MPGFSPDKGPTVTSPSEKAIESLVFHEQVALVCRLTPPTLFAALGPGIALWWILHLDQPSLDHNLWLTPVVVTFLGF